MRKVYLLITAALLLIGSGTMWADCTSSNAKATYEFPMDWSSSRGYICNSADITNAMLEWSTDERDNHKQMTVTINVQDASLFEVSDNASGECISNLEQRELKNDRYSTFTVKNKNNVEVNGLTNNFGVVYDNGDWIGGVQLNGYTGGSVTNNAHLYLYSGGIKGGCLVQNNSTGTVTVAGYVSASSTSQSATIANDGGTVNCTSGRFYPGATLTNNQGTVNFTGSCDITNGVQIVNNGGVINISGSSFKASNVYPNLSDKIAEILNNGGTINISDGTFDECNIINKEGTTGTIRVSGGKFKDEVYEQIKDFILPGYNVEITSGGYHQVVAEVVARVNGVAYKNVWKAIEASSNVDAAHHAVLQMDATVNFEEMLGFNLNYVLDLNGHNLLATGTLHMLLNCVQHGPQSFSIINSAPTKGGVITASDPYNQGILFYIAGVADASAENFSVLNIGEGVTIQCASDINYGVAIMPCSDNKGYGVVVNIDGKLLLENGTCTYIHGTVKATEGNVPQVNINNGAVLGNKGSECTASACIYAAGYGEWNIGAATLKAGTPIYAKSGVINVNGTKIEACGPYAEPVANSNGFNPTGDAIIVDSNESYAGNVQLRISGNSIVTSENGYAVQEALTKMDNTTAIELTIADGSFAGAKGTVKLSDEFAQALVDGQNPGTGVWTLNGVTSGKYTAKPEVVKDGYEVVEISDQFPFLYEVKEKTSTSYTSTTLDGDRDAYTVENGTELVIKYGQTINIGTLTIGTDESYPSRVRVQPGGTLVVGDIIMNNNKGAESLLLEADGSNGTGKLLYKSGSQVNTLGSVELFAHCRALDYDNKVYLFQHIGIPMYNTGASIEKNVPAAYALWGASTGWAYTSSDEVINQGVNYGSNITTSNPNAGSTFKFKGFLVGNEDAKFEFSSSEYGYKCLANSYTAPMSLVKLIDQYKTINGADGTVWIYKASDYETKGKNFVQWNRVDALDENAAIDPMQAFFVLHKANTNNSFTVSYNDAVYNYNKGLNAGIKGADAVTVENKGKISIFDGESTATLSLYEGEGLSDAFDMDYDGYQMETGNIQIYVTCGGEKWSSFASNSLKDKEIVIVSKDASEITMSFSKLGGNAFRLTDMASGHEVEVAEDKTYNFTIEPNSTVIRFKLGEGEVSAEEADADAVKIWVAENNLNIAGAVEGDAIEVINLAGIKVLSAVATGEGVQTISLSGIASGAYIVKAGAATVKFIK